MVLSRLIREFIGSEKSGGLLLICCTIISMVLANFFISDVYLEFWNITIGGYTLKHWINDGLMTVFFLMIGLELERELYHGELANPRDAIMPVFSAIGGMLIPAALFTAFNYGTQYMSGAGIPMATDIAFAIGILTLLGKKVPNTLKVFLITLAIIDDLGAIIVIAVFYTASFSLSNLLGALAVLLVLMLLNRLKVKNLIPYLAGGIMIWYFMHHSGVHATITGVILAFVIPFRTGEDKSPSCILQHHLHKPVAFIILPLFALANTAIAIQSSMLQSFSETYTLGIATGLIIGKPAGILFFALISWWLGLTKMPENINWTIIAGAGFLGGIGFTMSIFITVLAYDVEIIVNQAKMAVMLSSVITGFIGFFVLKFALRNHHEEQNSVNKPVC